VEEAARRDDGPNLGLLDNDLKAMLKDARALGLKLGHVVRPVSSGLAVATVVASVVRPAAGVADRTPDVDIERESTSRTRAALGMAAWRHGRLFLSNRVSRLRGLTVVVGLTATGASVQHAQREPCEFRRWFLRGPRPP